MADIQIALVTVAGDPQQLPTEGDLVGTPQVLTLSGSSQQSTVTVPATHAERAKSGMLYFRIWPYGVTAAFAKVGPNPQTASATTARGCPVGVVTYIPARNVGDVCAVIQAVAS